VCEQLVQSRYGRCPPELEPANSWLQVRRYNHYAITPHCDTHTLTHTHTHTHTHYYICIISFTCSLDVTFRKSYSHYTTQRLQCQSWRQSALFSWRQCFSSWQLHVDRFINRRRDTSWCWVDSQAVPTSVIHRRWWKDWQLLCQHYWRTDDAGMSRDCWHDNRFWSCRTIPDTTWNNLRHCSNFKELSFVNLNYYVNVFWRPSYDLESNGTIKCLNFVRYSYRLADISKYIKLVFETKATIKHCIARATGFETTLICSCNLSLKFLTLPFLAFYNNWDIANNTKGLWPSKVLIIVSATWAWQSFQWRMLHHRAYFAKCLSVLFMLNCLFMFKLWFSYGIGCVSDSKALLYRFEKMDSEPDHDLLKKSKWLFYIPRLRLSTEFC